MRFPYGETVTILRTSPGGGDAYGDPVVSTVTRTDIPLCGVAPRYSTEPTQRGRAGVVVGLSVYLPAGSPDVLPTDNLEVRGLAYDIEGDPADWLSPFTGWAPGSEVAIKRAVG